MNVRASCLGLALLGGLGALQASAAFSQNLPARGRTEGLCPAAGKVFRSVEPTEEKAGQTGVCRLTSTNGPHSFLVKSEDDDLLWEWFGIDGSDCIPPEVVAKIPKGYALSEECVICDD